MVKFLQEAAHVVPVSYTHLIGQAMVADIDQKIEVGTADGFV